MTNQIQLRIQGNTADTSYVTNHPSHKFYLNNGYHIIGYHFMQFF